MLRANGSLSKMLKIRINDVYNDKSLVMLYIPPKISEFEPNNFMVCTIVI